MTKSKILTKAGKLFILVMLILTVLQTVWFGVSAPVFAQSVDTAWVRRYNGPGNQDDYAYDLASDDSGNVYVTGFSMGSGTYYDFATIKYYPNGDTAWVRRYDGPGNYEDYAEAIAVDGSGNVYVTGESWGTLFDYATIKYYSNGDTAWVRRYNGPGNYYDEATDIAVNSDNIYVTGWSWATGPGSDYTTIKYYSNGDTAWVRRYSQAMAHAITVDNAGNVYVTGEIEGIPIYNHDYATIKYDSSGNQLWVRSYDGPGDSADVARAIAVDDSGNVYVTGNSWGSGTYSDYATIKYYPNGDTAWVRRYNGPANGEDQALGIALDDLKNVYVTGYSDSTGSYQDYATIKYDSSGNELWVGRYNGPPGNGSDYAYAIAVDGSNNAYVTGMSGGGATIFDYATIKYYSNGDIAWVTRYNGPGNAFDYASAIALDDSGNVYVTGQSDGSGSGRDYATIKYVQFLCGDVNKNGIVDLGDLVYLISYLYKSGPAPVPIVNVGDVNCDENVNLGDIVYLITYLYKDGPAPCC